MTAKAELTYLRAGDALPESRKLASDIISFTGARSRIVMPIAPGALIDSKSFAPARAFTAVLAARGCNYLFIVGCISNANPKR
ncbi:hypothetical protein O3W44_15980 [Pantoea sp. LMR881]|uniref:hypothetical protein n=1 Tax=Pantoea sp. LMR881 TaxID=3014336 RepID=UPI0022AE73B4|nr:hypothetical protein [Pantoea sp. LMR881]MCZ4060280.1 hypothetical protein [Pantoea sp. LMR881]